MTRAWTFRATLVAVAASLVVTFGLAFGFRNDIFSTLQDPRVPFQTYPKPPAPNYADSASWIAWPDETPEETAPGADVFVVVPEVYKGSESWNLPIDDARRRTKLERIVRPNYVDPYGAAGRLFAPLYRQAALYAFLNSREDSQAAQDLAYSDVRRAFEAFLRTNPPERPIVIVGHGQGAAHAQRLLRESFGGELRRKLAVAYIVDHPLPAPTDDDLPLCKTESQTRCVAAWTAVMPGETARAGHLRERALVHNGRRYVMMSGRDIACVNPLSWSLDDMPVDRSQHLGGVSAIGFEPDVRPTVHAGQVGAQCVGGLLEVDRPDVASLRRPRQFGGRHRTLPSNLFYEDLRQNAVTRVEAMLSEGALPRRAPALAPLEVETVKDAPVVPLED